MVNIIPKPNDAIIKPNELSENCSDWVKYELPSTNKAPAPIRLNAIEVVTVLNSVLLKNILIPLLSLILRCF